MRYYRLEECPECKGETIVPCSECGGKKHATCLKCDGDGEISTPVESVEMWAYFDPDGVFQSILDYEDSAVEMFGEGSTCELVDVIRRKA